MNNKELQDIYFVILEIFAEGNFCPYGRYCPYGEIESSENCVECLSEYIVASNRISENMLRKILGK